ncbi:hypothetical protein Tco_0410741 [Tanacetum coccineum]
MLLENQDRFSIAVFCKALTNWASHSRAIAYVTSVLAMGKLILKAGATEVREMSIRFAPTGWCRIEEVLRCSLRGAQCHRGIAPLPQTSPQPHHLTETTTTETFTTSSPPSSRTSAPPPTAAAAAATTLHLHCHPSPQPKPPPLSPFSFLLNG